MHWLPIVLVLLWAAVASADAKSGSSSSSSSANADQVCPNNDDNQCEQKEPRGSKGTTCVEQVLLFDGVPNLSVPTTPTSSGVRSTSLLNDQPAFFAKVSRFDDDHMLKTEDMLSNHLLHISANGDHMGWYVYVPSEECLREAKQLVAREIVASMDDQHMNDLVSQVDRRGPHRLVDEEGRVYPNQTTDANSSRLHLLLPRESFVHEAVKEGFVRKLSDGTILKTISTSPRVFVVEPILSIEECNELIDASSTRFQRSGEKHYAPGFENYRTSLSGHTPRSNKVAQKLWQRVVDITAMPETGVDFPSLIKYETNVSWYKAHLDYFHTYDDKPLEDLRVFVSTRAEELVTLGEEAISDVLDANSYERFDNIQRSMDQNIGARVAKDLGLSRKDDAFDARLLIHHHLRRSQDPMRDFSLASIHLSALLLEANGATEPMTLAEKYFAFDAPQGLGVDDYVPYFVKRVEFNRHATVLPILGEAEKGGHTAFPFSTSTLGVAPADGETIQECKRGLILKPAAGQALLFYNRLPTGEKDERSEHAGCSVQEGLKHAANCFTWDVDQAWAWRFQMKAEELYR